MKEKVDMGFRNSEIAGDGLHSRIRESDFDGHTSFPLLTFTEKLSWLSELVVSVYTLAKNNPEAKCNSIFDCLP